MDQRIYRVVFPLLLGLLLTTALGGAQAPSMAPPEMNA
jgi:hypothetical protein